MRQKDIKEYVKSGFAKDITKMSFEEGKELREKTVLETIATSYGVYGVNGALLRDRLTGELYGIVGRAGILFQLI